MYVGEGGEERMFATMKTTMTYYLWSMLVSRLTRDGLELPVFSSFACGYGRKVV